IRAAQSNPDERWQPTSGPARQPVIRARIEIVDFEAGHILDQRYPALLRLAKIRTLLRFSQKTQVQPVASVGRLLQPQRHCEITRRIASQQCRSSATTPPQLVAFGA